MASVQKMHICRWPSSIIYPNKQRFCGNLKGSTVATVVVAVIANKFFSSLSSGLDKRKRES